MARDSQYTRPMRLLGLCVLMVAACGATEDGATLALTPPAGLAAVARIDIVLASADPAMIETVADQRTSPKRLVGEPVTYYRQAASGGSIAGPIDMTNGFTIRIAPNIGEFPDTHYIPFVLLYAANGTLVGIATHHADTDPTPLAISVTPGALDKYTLDVQPVTAADRTMGIAPGQDALVDCASATTTWLSGFAWRPKTGPQVRVLLPDRGTDPAAKDALGRLLDLDCDAHVALADDTTGDCDDTLERYHRGADEACDGEDTNCDAQPYWTRGCTPSPNSCPNAMTGMGIQLCTEATGTLAGCQDDAECLCAGGTFCAKCTLTHLGTGNPGTLMPCAPAVGMLTLQGCTACTVAVLGATPGWEIEITGDPQLNGFGPIATNVAGHLFVRAKVTSGNSGVIMGTAGSTVGQFQLVVSGELYSIALAMAFDTSATACAMTNGLSAMTCQP
jgi:hypothetical protein